MTNYRTVYTFRFLLLAACMLMVGQNGFAAEIGIASGQPGGTNYPMVDNIVKVCSKPGAEIINVKSDGSLDNINLVYSSKNVQYSITQMDAAFYQKGVDPKMMDRIMMIFPFFSTEIQIVVAANSPIKTLADLQGKRVIEGPGDTSGTWVTAQVIKKLTGLQWKPMNASISDSVKAVANNQADAVIIVAGAPVKAISEGAGIRIIPVSHPALDGFGLYTKAIISSNTYPNQSTSISTYKVDNAMITYAFKNQYQKEIGDIVGCITRNIGTLQSQGHPKWRDVDPLDIDRISWPAHPAAVAAVKREVKHR